MESEKSEPERASSGRESRKKTIGILRLENDVIEYQKKKMPIDYCNTTISELICNVESPDTYQYSHATYSQSYESSEM